MFEKRVKGGSKRKFTLGNYPNLSLAGARKKALEIELEATEGIDRVASAKQARIEADRAKAARLTLEDVLSKYSEIKLSTLATGKSVERELRRAFKESLCDPINQLSRAQLQSIIDGHASEGHITYANRVRAYLRTFTKWAFRRDYLRDDVGASLEAAGREQPRDRVLSVGEIREIYQATFGIGEMWGSAFRLIFLTGQRRGEILGLRWSSVDFDERRLSIVGSQTKNRRPHITHLSPAALQELQSRHLKRGDNELVFTTTGKTPISGVSAAMSRLRNALGNDFEHWTLHDFRIAMATHLAGSGTHENIVDRIQNHAASGSAPSKVARVYQQHDLLPQRAAALDKWAAIVTAESGKVYSLQGSH